MNGSADAAAVKMARPIADVIAGYGVELRGTGNALVGRCPFHDDRGRPNLTVYEHTDSWYCFRCGFGGDVIAFVRRFEGVGFREALERLGGSSDTLPARAGRTDAPPSHAARERRIGPRSSDERACLAAAVELYRNTLLAEPGPLGYATARGVSRETLDRLHVGYCGGDGLVWHLRWMGLSTHAALRSGLLRRGRGGHLAEVQAGRVVVPEMRGGQPVWLVGRAWEPSDAEPKYLGLAGRKPLLGWERARDSREVYVTEGVFDWLALVEWGLPAVSLVGTQARPQVREALSRFDRVYLALDADAAGKAAAEKLASTFGARARTVDLPGVKDVAELALRADGRDAFLAAAAAAEKPYREKAA